MNLNKEAGLGTWNLNRRAYKKIPRTNKFDSGRGPWHWEIKSGRRPGNKECEKGGGGLGIPNLKNEGGLRIGFLNREAGWE
jgi:hypothetical protein